MHINNLRVDSVEQIQKLLHVRILSFSHNVLLVQFIEILFNSLNESRIVSWLVTLSPKRGDNDDMCHMTFVNHLVHFYSPLSNTLIPLSHRHEKRKKNLKIILKFSLLFVFTWIVFTIQRQHREEMEEMNVSSKNKD